MTCMSHVMSYVICHVPVLKSEMYVRHVKCVHVCNVYVYVSMSCIYHTAREKPIHVKTRLVTGCLARFLFIYQ